MIQKKIRPREFPLTAVAWFLLPDFSVIFSGRTAVSAFEGLRRLYFLPPYAVTSNGSGLGDTLDLHLRILRQGSHRHTGSRRILPVKKRSVNLIHLGKIIHIRQEDGGL